MSSLRVFVKAAPHAVKFIGTDAEGSTKTVKVTEHRSRWRDAEQALAECVKVDALDVEGSVLRTWVDPEFNGEVAGSTVRRAANTELVELGRLLNQAADQAVERQGQMVQQALDANNALVRVLSERNQQLERAWHRLLMQQEPQEGEGVEGSMMGSLPVIMQMLAAALGGMGALPGLGQPPAAPPKQNGKKE